MILAAPVLALGLLSLASEEICAQPVAQSQQPPQSQQNQAARRSGRGQQAASQHAAKKRNQTPLPTVPPPVRDPENTVQVKVRNYVQIQRQNIVMQRRVFSCGAACLATIGRYYWEDNVDEDLFLKALDEILTDEEIHERIENGLAMTDLRRAAVLVGYQAVVGQTTFDKLGQVKVPMIVGISPGGHDHFVVVRGTDFDWVYVADPIRGNIRMPAAEFREQWQENAILVIHKPGREVRKSSPLSVREEETSLGELNDHLIRTQPQRQPASRPPAIRP
jgi:predicted double-glycine peptidase